MVDLLCIGEVSIIQVTVNWWVGKMLVSSYWWILAGLSGKGVTSKDCVWIRRSRRGRWQGFDVGKVLKCTKIEIFLEIKLNSLVFEKSLKFVKMFVLLGAIFIPNIKIFSIELLLAQSINCGHPLKISKISSFATSLLNRQIPQFY